MVRSSNKPGNCSRRHSFMIPRGYGSPSDPAKRRRAVWLSEPSVLRAHIPLETCWVTMDSPEDKVLAAAVWLPPGPEIGSLTYLRYGFWKLPFPVGVPAFRRFLLMDKVMTAVRADHAPAHECWYLNTLGVSPDAQGKGLARRSCARSFARSSIPAGRPRLCSPAIPSTCHSTSEPVSMWFTKSLWDARTASLTGTWRARSADESLI